MKILIFNWRDKKNPLSGGAEILTHEMAKRFVAKGNEVTWFTSKFKNAKTQEIIDGINFIRDGEPDMRHLFNSVHYKAFKFYINKGKGKYDVIIDEIHGMPFFTPLYVKEPIIGLICEVAKDIWDKMFSFPWNKIGKTAEYFALQLYKNKKILTISGSTKYDLVNYGFNKKLIYILPMGINGGKIKKIIKDSKLTLIFVARVNKMKGIEDAIESIKLIKKINKDVRLWVVGKYDEAYFTSLQKKIKILDLTSNIKFLGYVSERQKYKYLSRSHFLITTSVREGFGLTVPEAGSVETPVVSYNSPGLRDIVNNNNGIIVAKNTPEAIAFNVIKLYNESTKYKKLRLGAKNESNKYNWDNTASEALSIINKL